MEEFHLNSERVVSVAGGGMKQLSGLGGWEALHSCGDDLVNCRQGGILKHQHLISIKHLSIIFYGFYIKIQPIQHFANFEFSINIDMEVNQQKLIENSPRIILLSIL